jgi:carbon monoxide dehydrogenase subunit G
VKVSESFVVPESRDQVWKVVGDVQRVAKCMPGVEDVAVVDDENATVRVTQSLGPMSATFDAKLKVTEREPGRLISFSATGRSVRGAAGNVRVTNSVRLEDEPVEGGGDATRVLLEADVAMGGMLGAVGGKVIARQAAQAAKEFAAALEQELKTGA